MDRREAWVFDVDGCLIDSLTGTSLRPLARELLERLRDRDVDIVLWSAGGGAYAATRAHALGIADLVIATYDKASRGDDGRWLADELHASHSVVLFVDDNADEIPEPVVAVSPYLGSNPHDRGLAALLERLDAAS